jgi:hypothetical protein
VFDWLGMLAQVLHFGDVARVDNFDVYFTAMVSEEPRSMGNQLASNSHPRAIWGQSKIADGQSAFG